MKSGQRPDMTSRTHLELAMIFVQSALDAVVWADGKPQPAFLGGCALPGDPVSSLRVFQGAGDQVRVVRDFVRMGLHDHPARDEAVLVASELATNAVIHSASGKEGGLFLVVVTEISADHAGVVVTDQGGPAIPHLLHADADAESGRGLAVVGSLSALCVTMGGSNMRSVFAVVPAKLSRRRLTY